MSTRVKCPYSDIIPLGFSRGHISKYADELECAGFIEIEHNGLSRNPNVYTLSDEWVNREYDKART